jgi:class 3 adenylate cyclase/predicted ATPase
MEARGASDGERKSITALFADIKGSTDLIAELDPEEARAILDPTLQLMMDAVHRYEGYVAQSLGDGIFALFGAPLAHEDHPQRALFAALLMQEENRKQAERLRKEKGINLQLRVGVNTGEVVLRSIRKDDLHTDYVPVGQSTNLASRMESLATPGSILVSEPTYKLTAGYFEFKALGEAQVKGFPEPLKIYEVAGVGPLRTKLQLSVKRGLARFVGRQHEMALLQQALAQAKAGHGQIAAVMGEPGVGKSRLFYEFKLSSQRGCLVLETFSVSHGKAHPYLPLIDLLKNYFQLTNQDDDRRRREKITGRVLTLDRSLEDTISYLFFLLGIAEPTSPLQQMDGQIRRKRILEAIKRLLLRESLNQPLIMIFEDLHWLDAETQAFLQLLSESVATTRMLILVNYRPEYQHQWSGKTYFLPLRLDPLSKEQAEEMLTALLKEAFESPLPHESLEPLKKFILDKTEGNPFFMEEIVQELREQGVLTDPRRVGIAHQHDVLRLPTTVQGVLTARMDRLPSEEKALLQTLAVIGREFSSSLLHKVVTEREENLQRMLSHLQAAEFVYEQPAFPEVEYIFKHALTQEVAYTSLLIERRKILHERTAQAMEEVYQARLEDHYSELAYHYSRSGNTQKAIDYLQLAGEQAVRRSANTEAITHLTTALELLTILPDTAECLHREIQLHVLLISILIATKGYAAPEVENAFLRARTLCEQIGETSHLFHVLYGLAVVYTIRGQLIATAALSEQYLLPLAQRQSDSTFLLMAHFLAGVPRIWRGDSVGAYHHLKAALSYYNPAEHRTHAFTYGQDFKVISLAYAALDSWLLGYSDKAVEQGEDAIQWAQEISHPHTLVLALSTNALVHEFRRDVSRTLQRAEAVRALASEHGLPFWFAHETIHYGWALAMQGQVAEGILLIHQGIDEWRATGAGLMLSHWFALLAEAYREDEQLDEGWKALTNALATVEETGERFWESELYRLKGELTLQKGKEHGAKSTEQESENPNPHSQILDPQSEAEACFLKAIEISQKQQAKSLELRSAISLARLWQQQDKVAEAHLMLSEIYNWFTEGFDTKDLQEAKTLLAELV